MGLADGSVKDGATVPSPKERLHLAAFWPDSTVNGPGRRAVVWFQGCSRDCAGCCNPQFQAHDRGKRVTVAEVAEQIVRLRQIEGVTYSGGEPLEQLSALVSLMRITAEAGLSQMVYTGYTYGEITAKARTQPLFAELLRRVDLMLCGPFRPELRQSLHYAPSSNQELIAVSEQYRAWVLHTASTCTARHEVRLTEDGELLLTGLPFPHTDS
ncbi:MAG: radical SAM protein [Lentisphaerae bacterium]|nr:MAG: radical SAM protein [Lentisphaerota bacterium]